MSLFPRRLPFADLAVAALAVLLAVAATWPMIGHFFSQVPGTLIADRDQDLWNLWWVKTALLDLHTNPYHTPLLYYPNGTDLYLHTLALPNMLIGLGPQLLAGLPAAYNTILLVEVALGIYGGFRLVRYVLARSGAPPSGVVGLAALAGGVTFGLHTHGLAALQGQSNVLSFGWMALFAEAWLRAWDSGRRRDAVLAGVFFVVTLLTSLYFGIYLSLFVLGWLAWRLVRAGAARPALLARAARVLPAAAVPVLCAAPFLAGVVASIAGGQFEAGAEGQQAVHSTDLLSLLLPPRTHPWLGAAIPWATALSPQVPDNTWQGWVAPALAIVGLAARRRTATAWGWALGTALALILALGATLHINGATPLGIPVPLPWALVQDWPIFNAIGKVDRFVILARLCLAPLVGWGVLALAGQGSGIRDQGSGAREELPRITHHVSRFTFYVLRFTPALALALLLIEVPWAAQSLAAPAVPAAFAAIATAPGTTGDALLELPLAGAQVRTMGARMLYQTVHGRPIMGGYLSRAPSDPLPECAPVWSLYTWDPQIADHDILTPHSMADPLGLMQRLGFRYLAVYPVYDPAVGNLVEPAAAARFAALAAATADGPPIAAGPDVTLYRVRSGPPPPVRPALQLGGGWGALETAGGQPFRWLAGADAGLCVENGVGQPVRLALEVTSFARPRTLELTVAGRTVLTATIPTGGAFATLTTLPLTLAADEARLGIAVPEGSTTPASLGQSADTRSLSLGFRAIRLLAAGAAP